MRPFLALVVGGCLLVMRSVCVAETPAPAPDLMEARTGFTTHLIRKSKENAETPVPPAGVLKIVHYPSAVGDLDAYLSPVPEDAKKHAAIIWIFGGFSNSIGGEAWEPCDPKADQSARAFREAGIVTMYPSFRGGNRNPGFKEGFYGEVDDVLAAREFLAKQPGIDPARIYLGGHSVGGATALLAAAASGDRFRAVLALGSIDEVDSYEQTDLTFDVHNAKEVKLRSPIHWLGGIHVPTFVFEGDSRQLGNIRSLRALERSCHNPLVRFLPVPRSDHFSAITPATKLFARKILADSGGTCSITISAKELDDAVGH